MAINEETSSWILSIKPKDFCGITEQQYYCALDKAKDRAKYIMTSSCDTTGAKINSGWGISEDDYNNDVSGQIQCALELLTTAEFLKKQVGLGQRRNMLGDYKSPTGESMEFEREDLLAWQEQAKVLENQAYQYAYDWICDAAKGCLGVSATGYKWTQQETEWFTETCPSYVSPRTCNTGECNTYGYGY